MPDLWLLTFSFGGAMLCAVVVCAAVLPRNSVAPLESSSIPSLQRRVLLGLIIGIPVGLVMQGLVPAWPPVSALDRWLLIGLPLLIVTELACSTQLLYAWGGWLRLAASVMLVPVVLFGSVHLQVQSEGVLFGLTANGLVAVIKAMIVTAALNAFSQRVSNGESWNHGRGILIACTSLLTLQITANVVMLGGWVGGGASVLPLTGVLTGMLLVAVMWRNSSAIQSTIRWANWALAVTLLLGYYFGRLTAPQSVLLMGAVLVPGLLVSGSKNGGSRRRCGLALFACILLLAVVLIPSVLEFQKRMSILLS